MLNKAIELIEAQQKAAGNIGHVFLMGEQLKDICRNEPQAAELVVQDLANPEMSLAKLKFTFDKFAREHRQGNESCITPDQAEELIRKFYGIPANQKPSAGGGSSRGGVIDLLDLL